MFTGAMAGLLDKKDTDFNLRISLARIEN